MSESSLRLVWVYPDLLSTYGDQGNALVVERRAQQRRVPVAVGARPVAVYGCRPAPGGQLPTLRRRSWKAV